MARSQRAAPAPLFNTSGLKYKSLALKDKLPTMTEDEQLHLLATDGHTCQAAFGGRG